MKLPKPDASYWDRKLAAYLHDPIDKVFQIKGHEERAARQLETLGLQKPNEAFWKKADAIASGFERGQVPTYSRDPKKNGAVDFSINAFISHPTSSECGLQIELPASENERLEQLISEKLLTFLKSEIGMKPGQGGYSDKSIFKNDYDRFAFARFLYVHHALRFKLSEKDVGGIGALWHRLPADSRFPDHSIWQHNALTSALYSCMELAKDERQVGMMAFSITPVQPFIAKARKLRDYWTGSVLLSWLAFEGLRWITENLGSDHLLYPSLVDQPLMNRYLQTSWQIDDINSFCSNLDIASLPNKFLFLAPLNQVEAIAADIKAHINECWRRLCEKVVEKVVSLTGGPTDHIEALFKRQTETYWEMQWATAKLLEEHDITAATDLLSNGALDAPKEMLESFSEIVKQKWNREMDTRGLLYSGSHEFVQTALAVQKTRKKIIRPKEPGRKCKLCGEFEVLHAVPYSGEEAAHEYKTSVDSFWKEMANTWASKTELDEGEHLCAMCLLKRIAYRVLKENKSHILHPCFDGADTFPSTTEMALYDEFKKKGIDERKQRQDYAQKIHESENIEDVDSRNRYYAVLVMDGDHMGKLINGRTIGATWNSAMHPEMKARLDQPDFDPLYRTCWQPFLTSNRRRLVTPAIHAAISESLGDFSIYGVAEIVKKYEGRLIYAGGDDVCAVLPVSTVVQAARAISTYYNAGFKLISGGVTMDVKSPWKPAPGKLSVHLGKNGDRISISAGILVCHHKEELSLMIARAHGLLDTVAKEKTGRNACAIELRKRSGGSRYFARRWSDADAWNAFVNLGHWIKAEDRQKVSTSLVYRMASLKDGVQAMLKRENHLDLLSLLLADQLKRSGIRIEDGNTSPVAREMSKIIVDYDEDNKGVFCPESLIVAAFMANAESEVN